MLVQRLQSFKPVACLGADEKLRPKFAQGFAQLGAEQRFVFGNNGGGGIHVSSTPAITSA
jgi:hypothetical protein